MLIFNYWIVNTGIYSKIKESVSMSKHSAMNPLVSVLMPVYKTAPFLREAMDSILAQTFTDFELIVLDDCSPDNAEIVLDEYDDFRIIRYKGERNLGLANVLNIGIGMAHGKYIARMDSDDISLPNRLQVQVDYMESHPKIDLCSCGMQLFGGKQEVWIRELDPEKVKITAAFFSPILHASSVWRKDVFESHSLRFRQEMVPAEDYDLWTRALLDGLCLVNIPEVLYHYRIRCDQASQQSKLVKEKSRKVQVSYLMAALPSLSEKAVRTFPKNAWLIFLANMKDGFFDSIQLAKRLYKIRITKQCGSPS